MEPFTIVKSKVIPLDRANVDTDQIVPKQFLKQVSKIGFGNYLFFDWRYEQGGKKRSDFVLNQPDFIGRTILLTRENFGIGSSREHAVWALQDFGFRSVIAPSFGDIFYENCFKNGLLPVRIDQKQVNLLFNHDCEVIIDLPNQTLSACGELMKFEINGFKKKLLLEGIDTITLTMQLQQRISEYEQRDRVSKPINSK